LASGHEADPGFDNVVFEAVYSGATTAGKLKKRGFFHMSNLIEFKISISDLRYQIPDGYSVFSKTICNINFLSDTYSNEKHYQNELKVILGLKNLSNGANVDHNPGANRDSRPFILGQGAIVNLQNCLPEIIAYLQVWLPPNNGLWASPRPLFA